VERWTGEPARESSNAMAIAEQAAVIDAPPDQGFYRPEQKPRREPVRLTPEQQKVFDREWSKRERKLRERFEGMREDLLELTELAQDMLVICKDRMTVEEGCELRDELRKVRMEYKEKAWQKPQK